MVDVAVVNSSIEVVKAIEFVLQAEGWTTVGALTQDFTEGREDLAAFLSRFDPAVIVWDIPHPYGEHWSFFQTVRHRLEAAGRPVVLTTTDERALRELVGPTGALEIVSKPFALEPLTAAVANAMRAAGRAPD